ncbi:hypothetical protein OSTOST_25625, partial [Ostertagia ostertagi]
MQNWMCMHIQMAVLEKFWKRTPVVEIMLTRAAIPFARAVRQCHQNTPVKFTGQTPTSFIHDGWANA